MNVLPFIHNFYHHHTFFYTRKPKTGKHAMELQLHYASSRSSNFCTDLDLIVIYLSHGEDSQLHILGQIKSDSVSVTQCCDCDLSVCRLTLTAVAVWACMPPDHESVSES